MPITCLYVSVDTKYAIKCVFSLNEKKANDSKTQSVLFLIFYVDIKVSIDSIDGIDCREREREREGEREREKERLSRERERERERGREREYVDVRTRQTDLSYHVFIHLMFNLYHYYIQCYFIFIYVLQVL